ncbi:MAG: transglycosylase SLT domain-containing protein [Fibromonadaceae bacterium]|jgi:soluble lytic murein transglycosylase-like protein|nr:transglycosylase SLT domain-containing protein [Fibromonadaceae bacterium]
MTVKYTSVALLACVLCQLSSASPIYPQATPQLPTAISFAGTRELASGNADAALIAIKADSPWADSQLWLYKFGVINARLGNTAEAVEALNTVSSTCQTLRPLAMEQIGDIAVEQKDFPQAMTSYSSVLGVAELPEQYRHELFRKIKSVIGNGIALPPNASWIDEYHQWEQEQQQALTATKPETVCDSLCRVQNTLWSRAWNLEMANNFKAAITNYRSVFNISGRRTEEAHIRHALCFYKLGKYDSVIVHINTFKQAFPGSTFFWAAMFWQGKAYAAQGNTEEAHKVWNQIARLNPFDYHAHRAMQLMGMADKGTGKYHAAPPNVKPISENAVREWLDSVPPPLSTPRKDFAKADSVALRRGAALLSVAQANTAVFFLDDYQNNYPGNLLLQYDLASSYAIAGSIGRAFNVGRRLAWRIPTTHRENIPLQVQSVIYPPFYAATISKYAKRFNVDPLFVSAVMRQESIFDSSLVSIAGAIGLMQVMPATGRKIAAELKEKNFATDSLFNTDLSIRYGVYYLRKRMIQFNGDFVLALCAYNAGANNAIKWRDRNRNVDYDIFAENIAFLETRGYVKRVLGNYWTYQRLVSTPGYEYKGE